LVAVSILEEEILTAEDEKKKWGDDSVCNISARRG
jgi:hypothetical protein